MRLIRVHVEDTLGRGALVALRGPAAAHVRRVLRLEPGDEVTLFNGDGTDYPGRIRAVTRAAVEVEVLGTAPARPESPAAIRLVQGVARAERMDLVVQKATELGVAGIQPVATARSVVRLEPESRARRHAHWRGVAIAACEQCGRARIPDIGQPMTLPAWLARPAHAGMRRLLLAADATESLAEAARDAQRIELLIGPEGGLEDGEHDAALGAGHRACRLGPRILRSETAAIAALAVLQSVAGDFDS